MGKCRTSGPLTASQRAGCETFLSSPLNASLTFRLGTQQCSVKCCPTRGEKECGLYLKMQGYLLPTSATIADSGRCRFSSRGSCGGTGKAYGWGLHLWALGWRGDIFPKTGLRDPRESAGVGGLGRAHGELGPEEVLPLPLPNGPWQHATFPHPFQPGHGNRCGQKGWAGASLVAQWLRVCLPVQGTRVRAPVWEDPTCRGATGPVSHGC